MREVHQGQFYRHFKDRLYQVVTVAEHSETGERMVVYQALYGEYRVYVRPYEMFVSEVDHEKYPQAAQKYRFELVKPENRQKKNCNIKVTGSESDESTVQMSVSETAGEESNGKAQVPEGTGEKTEILQKPADDGAVNPLLLEFLDAETLEDKMHIMIFGRNQMDDNLLNSIAISLDLVVEEKSTEGKYDEILNCLSMMERFECNRLR